LGADDDYFGDRCLHDFDFYGSHSIAVAVNLAEGLVGCALVAKGKAERKEMLGEKAAERNVCQRRFFMSRLKPRPTMLANVVAALR
jgi:hypothetical protein